MLQKIFFAIALVGVVGYATLMIMPIDPVEQRPGTKLSGELVEVPVTDWSFHESRTLVYVQTNTWYGIPHSITTTSMVLDGDLYVPCGWCATKRWPKNVASDPDVIVKVGGKRYPLRAELIEDPATVERVFKGLAMRNLEDLDGVALYQMVNR